MIETVFELEETRHQYQVIKLWEEEPERFLEDIALLPLASLTQTEDPEQLLNLVAEKVSEIVNPEERVELAAYVQLMAGLKYNRIKITQMFREDMMKDSVIYQEILKEGEDKGLQKGIEKGLKQGEKQLVIRLMTKKLGNLSSELTGKIESLSLEQLDNLAESLLDFSSMSDLVLWLEINQ